jgi:2-polyprenyl-6-methoxyphenol hydroxylase-like FAD-dependent oxidoreductase
MGKLSIGIAGAGIAGLAVAQLLARAGHRVVVFDQWQTPVPVGSGLVLQPVGLKVLEAMGLGADLTALGARIDRLFGRAAPDDRVVLDVRYEALNTPGRGLAVHRAALFSLLLKGAQGAGCGFDTGKPITGAGERRFVFKDGRTSAAFDLLVDATGVRSALAPRMGKDLAFGALWASLPWPEDSGFDPHTLEQRYKAARRMVGVLPIGRKDPVAPLQAAFFWSLKQADYAAWRAQPLAVWKAKVLSLWPQVSPLLAAIQDHDDLVFARYAHKTLVDPVGRGLVHIGDSYHSTSPQLGQGANMALLDAFALSTALTRQPNLEVALGEYARMRAAHVRLYQWASYLLTPVYQSDWDGLAALRDHVAAPLMQVWPVPLVLAGLVAGQIGAPLRGIGLR